MTKHFENEIAEKKYFLFNSFCVHFSRIWTSKEIHLCMFNPYEKAVGKVCMSIV